jgi:hypothetical protein
MELGIGVWLGVAGASMAVAVGLGELPELCVTTKCCTGLISWRPAVVLDGIRRVLH